MTGWIEEDAERGAWLVFSTGCTELHHCSFADIEVVHHHVDVHLLRNVLPGPDGTQGCGQFRT